LLPPILRKGDYIYGSFLKPEAINGYINNTNPAQKDMSIGQYSFSFSSIPQAIAYAKATHTQWANKDLQSRIEPIKRFQEDVIKIHPLITKIISLDCGYPLREASIEVNESVRFLQYLIDAAPGILEPIVHKRHTQRYTSIGSIALLTPHVHSFYTSVLFSASALLSGNVVIHKPSRYTPAIGQLIAEIWDRCSLKRGVYNMVQGPGTHISQQIIQNAQLDGVLFAGEYDTAKIIHRRRPLHLPLRLFCGGKGSAIVLENSDVPLASRHIVLSAVRAGGESPYGVSRVFVSETIAEELIETLKTNVEVLNLGPPNMEVPADLGPMISEQALQTHTQQMEEIIKEGHSPLYKAQKNTSYDGFFIDPTIIEIDKKASDLFLDVEIKGPTLLVYVVKDHNEAIQYIRKCAYHRSITIFTDTPSSLPTELMTQLHTGTLSINKIPSFPIVSTPTHGRCSNGYREGLGLLRALTVQENVPTLHP
jgi:acyl-CoA reductase-like NAD-dependent aldehyde dehydrogenase